MKKIIISLLLLSLVGCTTQTEHGPCVGVVDQKNPSKVYEYSSWNIFLGILFSETIVVPAIVVAKELECPIGEKNAK